MRIGYLGFMEDTIVDGRGPVGVTTSFTGTAKKATHGIITLASGNPLGNFGGFLSHKSVVSVTMNIIVNSTIATIIGSVMSGLVDPLVNVVNNMPSLSKLLAVAFGGSAISFNTVLGTLVGFLLINITICFYIVLPVGGLHSLATTRSRTSTRRRKPDIRRRALTALRRVHSRLGGTGSSTRWSTRYAIQRVCLIYPGWQVTKTV